MDFTSAHPDDLLFDAARRGDVARLQAQLAAGVNINAQNPKGFTALVLASYDDHLDAAKFLLEAGADPNLQDVTGNTALMGRQLQRLRADSALTN
jgi:ankyrin repeat protein